jgi:hypothetical protein
VNDTEGYIDGVDGCRGICLGAILEEQAPNAVPPLLVCGGIAQLTTPKPISLQLRERPSKVFCDTFRPLLKCVPSSEVPFLNDGNVDACSRLSIDSLKQHFHHPT